MKRSLFVIIFLGIFFMSLGSISATPRINLINMTPSLDFTRFLPYNITANITNSSPLSSVQVNISGVTPEYGACWDFYINGTCASEILNFDMTYYESEGLWKKINIYPDYIYPEVFFAPSEITWRNEPSNISLWRGSYHLFNFTNRFTMVENMSFWIEFNTISRASNSQDLLVYIVSNGSNSINLDYFTSDWRSKANTELVGTISRNSGFNHQHTSNSSHHLIALSTNSDGTLGSNSLNVSENFWMVLYQDSNQLNRGWNLRYQSSSLCTNQDNWYIGTRNGGNWIIPAHQAGCPDAHIHVSRNNVLYMDGVNATVIATDESDNINITSQDFYYGELPNLAPNPISINNPISGGVYNSSQINVTWDESSDPNGDYLTYNLSLLNLDSSFNSTLNVTFNNYYLWNITDVSNGNYNLRIEVCDDASTSLCMNTTLSGTFLINKTIPVYNLTGISISSNNSINSSYANENDSITICFNSSGLLTNLSVLVYSGGYNINNSVSIENNSYYYNATYIVNSMDSDGYIGFDIKADNLDLVYTETIDNSFVYVDKYPPSLDITSPLNITYTTSTILLNISSTDSNGDSIWYNWNGTNYTYSSPINITFNEGSNTLYAWANDSLGNINYTNISFSVEVEDTQEENDNQETSSGGVYVPRIFYTDINLPKQGNDFNLRYFDKIKFKVRTNNHTLTMQNFNSTSAKVKIESDPIYAWLEKDVLYEFDLDNDSINDVRVRYDGRDSLGKANIFIQEIVFEDKPEITKEPNQELSGNAVTDVKSKKTNLTWVIWTSSIIILIILIVLIQSTHKKKRSKKS